MTGAAHIAPIVEGHGEVEAVPTLLRRLVPHLDDGCWAEVSRPFRVTRGTLGKTGELERYVELAARSFGETGAVLVLLDADDDCAASLGPELLARARARRPDVPIGAVVAVREYEAWFLASAASLRGRRGLELQLEAPGHPQGVRDAKGWLQDRRTDGLAYSPAVDEPALTALFDIDAARGAAPSFDKLCREVRRLVEETR